MKKFLLIPVFLLLGIDLFAILTPTVDSVVMSDGRKLAVDIHIPQGMNSGPVILIQTPYNRQLLRITGLPLGIGQGIDTSQYIFVVSDWRGFYGSRNAAYFGSPDNGTDGYSMVEWIASQTWSNGKIGTWGPSALGKIQYQTAAKKPPHLTCICPLVAAPQFEFTEYYPYGVLRTEYIDQLDQLGFGLGPTVISRPIKDLTWQFVEYQNKIIDSIEVPAFLIGGWYDHNADLMMKTMGLLKNSTKTQVRDKHKILMGPWVHGGHGTAQVGTQLQGELSYPNAQGVNNAKAVQFFDYYLRGVQNGWELEPVYNLYQMGTNMWNYPKELNLSDTIHLYLKENNLLSEVYSGTGPINETYTYNPGDPSPSIGGTTLRADLDQGPYDQRNEVENRSDVLIFTTGTANHDIEVGGKIKAVLYVSSNRTDTDFDLRITDVYPDGRSMLITDIPYRMRYRNGFRAADTSGIVPNQIYRIELEFPVTNIAILKGHKLRLLISSSNYPKYNRNMNNNSVMYPGLSSDSLLNPLIAENTVHFNFDYPSHIALPSIQMNSIRNVFEQSLNIYPVPANDQLYVESKSVYSGYKIWNIKGQLICTGNFEDQTQAINLDGITEGLYIIELQGLNSVVRRKFSIEH